MADPGADRCLRPSARCYSKADVEVVDARAGSIVLGFAATGPGTDGEAVIATLATGSLVDRMRRRNLLVASMALLTAAILILPFVTPGFSAALYRAAVGASGGSARALEAAEFPRFFGTVHLGGVRGIVMASSVAGTAGPILLALGHGPSGSYVPVLRWSLVLPLAIGVLGVLAPPPGLRPGEPAVSGDAR